MAKNTDEMKQEILAADNYYDVLDKNAENFRAEALTDHLKGLLKKKGMKAAEAIKNSNLDRSYGHQVISGKRIPSRDKLIALAMGMGLELSEVDELMKVSGNRTLYARDPRDGAIMFAFSRHMSLDDLNIMLDNMDHKPIE